MSSIVYLKNKKTGKVYAYLNESQWDPEKKKCVCRRKCLGHLDPETGDIVPNRGNAERDYAEVSTTGSSFFLEQISENIGLKKALKTAMPDNWKIILSTVFYIMEENMDLLGLQYWSSDNSTPYGKTIFLEKLESVLSSIDENSLISFFKEWRDSFKDGDFYLMDLVSTSAYDTKSESISFNFLPMVTVNPKTVLNVIYSVKENMPLAFFQMPKPPKTMTDLRRRENRHRWLSLGKTMYLLDKEFCNKVNLDSLLKSNEKFLMRASPEFSMAKESIVRVKDRIMDLNNYKTIDNDQLFVMSFMNYWGGKKCFTHIYFSTDEAENEFSLLLSLLDECKMELENNIFVVEHKDFYDQYFNVIETSNGRIVEQNGDAIMAYNDIAGFFVLISNVVKNPVQAYRYYKTKDNAQLSFENLKNQRDRRALKLYSDANYTGRLFLQFISLILHSHMDNVSENHAVLKELTGREILHEMSSIKRVSIPGFNTPFYTNINKSKLEIMKLFSVDPSKMKS